MNKSLKKISNIFLILVVGISVSGCLGVNRDFRNLREQINETLNTNYREEIEIAIGPSAILFASMFINFAETDEELDVGAMLGQLSRVQFGVYKNENFDSFQPDSGIMQKIDRIMKEKGWNYLVKSVNDDEISFVYFKDSEKSQLRNMFVIHADENEFVMVDIYGDLEELIAVAVRQNGLKFDVASN